MEGIDALMPAFPRRPRIPRASPWVLIIASVSHLEIFHRGIPKTGLSKKLVLGLEKWLRS